MAFANRLSSAQHHHPRYLRDRAVAHPIFDIAGRPDLCPHRVPAIGKLAPEISAPICVVVSALG
jgi:hypothetical protein